MRARTLGSCGEGENARLASASAGTTDSGGECRRVPKRVRVSQLQAGQVATRMPAFTYLAFLIHAAT